MWKIWKERNTRIFQSSSTTPRQLQDLILLRLSWWIKGWSDPFPYSSEDVICNPECLQWSPTLQQPNTLHTLQSTHQRSPPPKDTLKCNVDASLNSTLHRLSIGGVLRDSNGSFICMFSTPMPTMEINSAEVFAIHRALKVYTSNDMLANQALIIESDSANDVRWCGKELGGPWNLHFALNFIRNTSPSSPNISITHKSRASNTVADALAKQGLGRRDEFLAWM
ncbi:uncharacterized protein [Spinacia oleracea]|uniref:RNase H type-1 domain-containing protein n=1 Tax=Spinacia oleracea TaxID=3562 RepID=A0ABM3QYX3_SPIOL|nr:uncharacterized protein LOC130463464 [Spinacia oleracea]